MAHAARRAHGPLLDDSSVGQVRTDLAADRIGGALGTVALFAELAGVTAWQALEFARLARRAHALPRHTGKSPWTACSGLDAARDACVSLGARPAVFRVRPLRKVREAAWLTRQFGRCPEAACIISWAVAALATSPWSDGAHWAGMAHPALSRALRSRLCCPLVGITVEPGRASKGEVQLRRVEGDRHGLRPGSRSDPSTERGGKQIRHAAAANEDRPAAFRSAAFGGRVACEQRASE